MCDCPQIAPSMYKNLKPIAQTKFMISEHNHAPLLQ